MKIKIPTPQPTLWPSTKAGVLEVAASWMKPDRVALNDAAFAKIEAGSIKAPESTNLTIAPPTGELPVESLTQAIEYSIAMNSINYMFWSLNEDGKFIRYEKDGAVGANAMTKAFSDAWHDSFSGINLARDGIPLDAQHIEEIFGDIPDPEGRARVLNEILVGPKLGAIAQELAQTAIDGGAFDVQAAARLAQAFPGAYGDAVLKKSQLAVSAMWRNAMDLGVARECELTAFADYQIPNVLRALGLLDYASDLAETIDAQRLIAPESVDERALRAASILAVERLAQEHGVNVADVDYWLWTKRKEPKTPFHLTETTLY